MTESTSSETLILKNKSVLIWAVLAAGWLFDFLFWDKTAGISMAIYLLVLAAVGFVLARYQGITPARSIYWLLIPLTFFSIMTFIRAEPMTTFLNIAASLFLLGVIAHSFTGGRWWQYRFKDYLTGAFSVTLDTLFRQISIFAGQPKAAEAPNTRKQGMRTSLSILRGVLIALPVVLIFAAMLSEADPIFGQAFEKFVDFFDIENLGEYIFRAVLICFLGYLLLGVYLHAYYKDHDTAITDEEQRVVPRFLGITEAAIVLGAVNLLFLAFVSIQFQYFFGGQTNINLEGYTYAEYARRGFGELVAVAVFSLLLFLGLSFVTKKEHQTARRVFSGMGVLLFALVSVILVSSFQRLLLYEAVYGFTQLRTYTHVFIIWLGALLLAVSALEVLQKQRYFALAGLVAAIGFVATLNILNVDAFIVRQNVERMVEGEPLDVGYLSSLTEDAVPVMSDLYNQAEDPAVQEALAGALACHAVVNEFYDYANRPYQNYTWQSFHLARHQAQQDWQDRQSTADADRFSVQYYDDEYSEPESWWNAYVIVGGEEVGCGGYYGWD
jgi:hypothetical protein